MGKYKKSWYEREEGQKITLDILKSSTHLTSREFELLNIISERKLVRRKHLEMISESYRNYNGEDRSRTNSLNRSITKMYRNTILDKTNEPQVFGKGNTSSIVSLDRGGSILLGIPHKPRIIQRKQELNNQTIVTRNLPANFRHIDGVNKLEVETIQFCEEHGYEIIAWTHEQNNKKTIFYGQDKITLIPDVFLILKIGKNLLFAFLEYDTGSESLRYKEPPIIREKIEKYRVYKMSKLWLEEDWIEYMDKPQFPMVLFVTEDYKRIEFFNNKSKELGVKGLGIYYENYQDVIKKIATLF